MELRHLRYFVAVAENLNFTRAAQQLHLAQPALTRQIRALEEELGVRLFDRSKNHVALTQQGRGFLTDARRLLAMAGDSIRAVQGLERGEAGQLRIAYLSKFNFELLPKTLEVFGRECPDIGLNLFDMTPAEQFRQLRKRKIDLGFVGLRFSAAAKGLQWECIARHKAAAVMPQDHPLAGKGQVELGELSSSFFVGLSESTQPGFREWLVATCQKGGFTPRVLEDAESEAALLNFVAEGLGVALAREHIQRLPHTGVVFRPLTVPVITPYYIAWNGDNDSRALAKYIQTIQAVLKG